MRCSDKRWRWEKFHLPIHEKILECFLFPFGQGPYNNCLHVCHFKINFFIRFSAIEKLKAVNGLLCFTKDCSVIFDSTTSKLSCFKVIHLSKGSLCSFWENTLGQEDLRCVIRTRCWKNGICLEPQLVKGLSMLPSSSCTILCLGSKNQLFMDSGYSNYVVIINA